MAQGISPSSPIGLRSAPASTFSGRVGEYDAFISYSQSLDKPIAQALRAVIQTIGKPWWKARSLNVFLDATSLSAAPDLWAAIETRLRQSRFLILLASREAAASKWVDKEVQAFIGLQDMRLDRVLIALTDGDLVWDEGATDFCWDDATPLPPCLRGRFRAEPLWVDLRGYRNEPSAASRSNPAFLNAALDLAAPIHGVDKSDLYSEELNRRKRNMRTAYGVAVSLAGLTIAAGISAWLAILGEERANLERDNALTVQSRFLADMAQQQVAKGDYGTALALALDALPDAKRGVIRPEVVQAEAAAYSALWHLRERRVLEEKGALNKAVFSPDGTNVLLSSADGTASVWEVATGSKLAVVDARSGMLYDAKFSPDARFVAAAGMGGMRLWDAATGLEVGERGSTGLAFAVAFSADGKRLAVGELHGRVAIWDIASARDIATFQAHNDNVTSVDFSPDGKLFATGSDDGTIRVWDAETWRELLVLRDTTRAENAVNSVAFSPDSTRIIAAFHLENALIWTLTGGDSHLAASPLPALMHGDRYVGSASFSADGTHALTASGDFAVLWDLSTLRSRAAFAGAIAIFTGHASQVNAADFAPDGQSIVTASADQTARLWTITPPLDLGSIGGPPDPEWQALHRLVTVSPNGRRLMAIHSDESASLWDVSSGLEIADLPRQGRFTVVEFSSDAKRVATALANNVVRVWDAADGTLVATLVLDLNDTWQRINSISFSPDGLRLAAASSDGMARIFNVATRTEVAVLEGHTNEVQWVSFSPDGTLVVTASDDASARIWNAATGAQVVVLKGHSREVRTAVFSPDGKSVATTAEDSTARLWNAATGAEIAVFSSQNDYLHPVSFSPDSRLVATSTQHSIRLWNAATGDPINEFAGLAPATFSSDSTRLITPARDGITYGAVLWDTASGAKIAGFYGHFAEVYSAQFTADSTRILTASADRTARLWRVFPKIQDLVDFSRSVSPRGLTPEQRKQFFLN